MGLRCSARLSFQLDILRLITRGLLRNRRLGRWRCISAGAWVSARASREGGKGRLGGDLAAGEAQGTGEGDPVGVDAFVQGCLVHECADGVVGREGSRRSPAARRRECASAAPSGVRPDGYSARRGNFAFPSLGVQRGQIGR